MSKKKSFSYKNVVLTKEKKKKKSPHHGRDNYNHKEF